jgi:cyclophilin family peptidyl-prolyl cis-trans isomerase
MSNRVVVVLLILALLIGCVPVIYYLTPQPAPEVITVELLPEKAPDSVKNFLQYVDDKFYDGTIFHRVIGDFMIQGGGMNPGLTEKRTPHPPVKNEADNGLSNTRGTIAMARTGDPNSATAQFYINTVDNGYRLDRAHAGDGFGYTVFGEVTDGMDVVDKIKKARTHHVKGMDDVPVKDVVIESIRKLETPSAKGNPVVQIAVRVPR